MPIGNHCNLYIFFRSYYFKPSVNALHIIIVKKNDVANWHHLAAINFFILQFCAVEPKLWTMNVERIEFIAWMERIMERFDILSEMVNKAKNQHANIDGEELLDNQDIMQMLKISARSLQRYRSIGKLPYYTITGKIYYKLSDVHQFVRDSLSTQVREQKPMGDKGRL